MHQVVLGPETDDALFERLRNAIAKLGGTIEDTEWTLGGSQEVTRYTIALPNGRLEAVAETYAGLSLRGDDSLIAAVCSHL